jgi:hypothetical protein
MTHPNPNRPTAPHVSETCLGDPSGWHACWTVEDTGRWWPWLLRPDAASDAGCSCVRCAPHEQLGMYPLPGLALCGAPTQHGAPCSRYVGGRGPCWQHQRAGDRERQR